MAITKCINSESKQYKPVLTDKLVLDAVPTVNSLNSVTSDAVARAIAGASGEVPAVTESDNGKVLKAIYDAGGPAVEWGEATVDQTYDATSTNAQSGVAVASAIAAIPSEVTTASGHFDLEGSVPVTVNYTGTPHVVPGTATFTNPTITEIGDTGLAVVFTLNPAHALTDTESGSLNIPANSPVTASVTVSYTNSASGVGGPGITADPSLPNSKTIVPSGTYTLTSQYNIPGYDNYVGLMFSLQSESDRPSLKAWAESLTLDWPSSVVDGYETTIPAVDQNYHSESANAQSGVAVAQAIAAIPSASYTAGDGISISAQNSISANAGTGLVIGNSVARSTQDMQGSTIRNTQSNQLYSSIVMDLDQSFCDSLDAGDATVTLSNLPGSNFGWYIGYNGATAFSPVYFCISPKEAKTGTLVGYLPSSDNILFLSEVYDDVAQNAFVPLNVPYTLSLSDIDVSKSNLAWADVKANPTNYCLALYGEYTKYGVTNSHFATAGSDISGQQQILKTGTISLLVDTPNCINVSNPLPAFSSADAGRVLQVQNDGTLAWVTLS